MTTIIELLRLLFEHIKEGDSPLSVFLYPDEFADLIASFFEPFLNIFSRVWASVFSFFSRWLFNFTFDIFDNSYDSISESGMSVVDNLFRNLSFTNSRFNFIYFFIGLLFLLLIIKLIFIFTPKIIDFILQIISIISKFFI